MPAGARGVTPGGVLLGVAIGAAMVGLVWAVVAIRGARSGRDAALAAVVKKRAQEKAEAEAEAAKDEALDAIEEGRKEIKEDAEAAGPGPTLNELAGYE